MFATKGIDTDIAHADLVIFAVGYEARSIAVAQQHHTARQRWIGIGFGSRQLLSFGPNREWVESAGVEYHEVQSRRLLYLCRYFVIQPRSLGRTALRVALLDHSRRASQANDLLCAGFILCTKPGREGQRTTGRFS